METLISVLDWHGDTLSWAAVVKAVSKAGYNRIAKKLPTNILLFHKLAALYQCVSTLANLSVPSCVNLKRMCRSNCRCLIPATVDTVVPISEQGSELHWQSTNLQQELQILYILSIMHILSIVRGEFFSLHRTLKCKYSKKWSRHKLENGETQVQACSIRDYSSVISQKLNKIQQFAQKYNRHVG